MIRVTPYQMQVLRTAKMIVDVALTTPPLNTPEETEKHRHLIGHMNESVEILADKLEEAYAEIDRLKAEAAK